jgi:hypothetical protein
MKSRIVRVLSALVLPVAVAALGCAAEATPPAGGGSDGTTAARVGDTVISMDAVDERARQIDAKTYQALYNARKAALDALVGEELAKQEAKARGISTEELRQQEIDSKVAPVTDADVQSFFNSQQSRMRGRTLEQMSGQIREYLEVQRSAQAESGFIAGLKTKYNVSLKLEPPRTTVAIAKNDPRMGPDSAPVKIIEFSDFQ